MYIGVDIGGTKIAVASAIKIKPGLKDKTVFPTPPNAKHGLAQIIQAIETLAAGQPITAIGVSAPGTIDFKRGIILHPHNLPWRNVPIVKILKNHFRVPVVIENDANCGAIAEHHSGTAHGLQHFIYLTISTGIGTGIFAGGQLYHGAHDTESGYQLMCNPSGDPKLIAWEEIAAGPAIYQHYHKYGYQIKDEATWRNIAATFAPGIYNLSQILSPEAIILGGGVSVHYRRFHRFLAAELKTFPTIYPLPIIKVAHHTEEAAVLGALIVAAQSQD